MSETEPNPNDIMFQRLDEYEAAFGELDPMAKAIFNYAYAIGRTDTLGDLSVDFTDPNRTKLTFKPNPKGR